MFNEEELRLSCLKLALEIRDGGAGDTGAAIAKAEELYQYVTEGPARPAGDGEGASEGPAADATSPEPVDPPE